MAKILRIHQGTSREDLKHWEVSDPIGADALNSIKTESTAEITSIPSPFARIDLIKTAFAEVYKYAENPQNPGKEESALCGTTIYHKMVSDTLDVAELFFKARIFADKLRIIHWDKVDDINALLKSDEEGHRILGQTLQTYLEQDKKTYNFDKMRRIYLLQYIGKEKKSDLDIIGATSPATLFFSIANDFSYLSDELRFDNDKPFDKEYCPLHKRDNDFVLFLFAIKAYFTEQRFNSLFPEVGKYLKLSYKHLSPELTDEIARMETDADYVTQYAELTTSDGNDRVEVIDGLPMFCQAAEVNLSSDFEIATSICNDEKLPLVLPTEKGNKYNSLKFSHGNWDGKTPAPYFDPKPISDRRLPQTSEQYPYLTVSDFLEDSIMMMPYQLNKDAFFDANREKNENSYLLPLTDTFFKYFTVDDIINKRMIEFFKNSGGIKVMLHIPIKAKGKTIDYERIYFANNDANIAADKNDGALIEKNEYFSFAMLPNIRFEKDEDAFYRFSLGRFGDNGQYSATFYDARNQPIENVQNFTRNEGDTTKYPTTTAYAIEHKNISYIRVSDGTYNGVILPICKPQQSSGEYTFAIDFGTSNTHIEYKSDLKKLQRFDIDKTDKQIQFSCLNLERIIKNVFEQELCPEYIGDKEISKFPMRSALLVAKNCNWNKSHFALGQANFAYLYEKRFRLDYNKMETNLKWSSEVDNEKMVSCFIESLFFALRNKVVINGGKLEKTKITWFYPLSMTQARMSTFKRVWEEAYQKYFGEDTSNVIAMNESVAPYYYFKQTQGSVNNIVTIDIGGETTDIVIANHGDVQHITSFRFAANAIFGDFFAKNQGAQNGIVRQFTNKILRQIDDNGFKQLRQIYENLNSENNSANIASFFFSLIDNKDAKDKNVKIDFNYILQLDNTQKIVFLIFYCAIMYHLAQVMKTKNLEMPRHIAFSGNGAKVIPILSSDNALLAKLSKKIFEKVYNKPYPSDGLEVMKTFDNPKAATCMGGILNPESQTYSEMAEKKLILEGITEDGKFVGNEQTYKSIMDNKEKYLNGVINQAEKFIDFVFELNKGDLSFRDCFGINQESVDIAKKTCKRDLRSYAENKLNAKLKEVTDQDRIEETMFFYPLNGVLSSLTTAICETNIDKPNN